MTPPVNRFPLFPLGGCEFRPSPLSKGHWEAGGPLAADPPAAPLQAREGPAHKLGKVAASAARAGGGRPRGAGPAVSWHPGKGDVLLCRIRRRKQERCVLRAAFSPLLTDRAAAAEPGLSWVGGGLMETWQMLLCAAHNALDESVQHGATRCWLASISRLRLCRNWWLRQVQEGSFNWRAWGCTVSPHLYLGSGAGAAVESPTGLC